MLQLRVTLPSKLNQSTYKENNSDIVVYRDHEGNVFSDF